MPQYFRKKNITVNFYKTSSNLNLIFKIAIISNTVLPNATRFAVVLYLKWFCSFKSFALKLSVLVNYNPVKSQVILRPRQNGRHCADGIFKFIQRIWQERLRNQKEINERNFSDPHPWIKTWSPAAVSIRKTVLPGMAIPMLKIRRPNGRLILNMEIAIRR